MPQDPNKVREVIENFAKEFKLKRKITDMVYRADCHDYQFVLDNTHHVEIREKLIDAYFADNKSGDVRREIKFRLENPAPFEESEQGEVVEDKEEKIEVEDKEKYDFI